MDIFFKESISGIQETGFFLNPLYIQGSASPKTKSLLDSVQRIKTRIWDNFAWRIYQAANKSFNFSMRADRTSL